MSALLMLAASSAFMSPFGYQTNLMVVPESKEKTDILFFRCLLLVVIPSWILSSLELRCKSGKQWFR